MSLAVVAGSFEPKEKETEKDLAKEEREEGHDADEDIEPDKEKEVEYQSQGKEADADSDEDEDDNHNEEEDNDADTEGGPNGNDDHHVHPASDQGSPEDERVGRPGAEVSGPSSSSTENVATSRDNHVNMSSSDEGHATEKGQRSREDTLSNWSAGVGAGGVDEDGNATTNLKVGDGEEGKAEVTAIDNSTTNNNDKDSNNDSDTNKTGSHLNLPRLNLQAATTASTTATGPTDGSKSVPNSQATTPLPSPVRKAQTVTNTPLHHQPHQPQHPQHHLHTPVSTSATYMRSPNRYAANRPKVIYYILVARLPSALESSSPLLYSNKNTAASASQTFTSFILAEAMISRESLAALVPSPSHLFAASSSSSASASASSSASSSRGSSASNSASNTQTRSRFERRISAPIPVDPTTIVVTVPGAGKAQVTEIATTNNNGDGSEKENYHTNNNNAGDNNEGSNGFGEISDTSESEGDEAGEERWVARRLEQVKRRRARFLRDELKLLSLTSKPTSYHNQQIGVHYQVLEGQAILCITSDSVPTAAALNLLNDIHGQVAGELQNGGGRLTLRKPNLPRLLHQNMESLNTQLAKERRRQLEAHRSNNGSPTHPSALDGKRPPINMHDGERLTLLTDHSDHKGAGVAVPGVACCTCVLF